MLLPWAFVVLIAVRKKNMLALGGLAWAVAALPPVAFIHQIHYPRHYYLALPGIAIFLAAMIQNWRIAAALLPVLSLVCLSNVALYAEEAWLVVGSRMTKQYVSSLRTTAQSTGKTEFYISPDSDPGLTGISMVERAFHTSWEKTFVSNSHRFAIGFRSITFTRTG